jgi:hypothetical protein
MLLYRQGVALIQRIRFFIAMHIFTLWCRYSSAECLFIPQLYLRLFMSHRHHNQKWPLKRPAIFTPLLTYI